MMVFFEIPFFWHLLLFVVLVTVTKSALASLSVIIGGLSKQLTLLDDQINNSGQEDASGRRRGLGHGIGGNEDGRENGDPQGGDESGPEGGQLPFRSTSSLSTRSSSTRDQSVATATALYEHQLSVMNKLRMVRRIQASAAISFSLLSLLLFTSPFFSPTKPFLSLVFYQLVSLCLLGFTAFTFRLSKSNYRQLAHQNSLLVSQHETNLQDEDESRDFHQQGDHTRVGWQKSSSSNPISACIAFFWKSIRGSSSVSNSSYDALDSAGDLMVQEEGEEDENDQSHIGIPLGDPAVSEPSLIAPKRPHGKRYILGDAKSSSRSSLLHEASLLADGEGMLTEESKTELLMRIRGAQGADQDHASLEISVGDLDLDSVDFVMDDRKEDVERRKKSVRFESAASAAASSPHSSRNRSSFPPPFNLLVIYPPTVVRSNIEKEGKEKGGSISSPSSLGPAGLESSGQVSMTNESMDLDDEPMKEPFTPVPLHPKLAAKLKRSSPLPPSMSGYSPFSSPPGSPQLRSSGTAKTTASPGPTREKESFTIKPPLVAFAILD
jgi:hypothetical protein